MPMSMCYHRHSSATVAVRPENTEDCVPCCSMKQSIAGDSLADPASVRSNPVSKTSRIIPAAIYSPAKYR